MASDMTSYLMILGTTVLPLFIAIKVGERIMEWTFEAQSILISLPIP